MKHEQRVRAAVQLSRRCAERYHNSTLSISVNALHHRSDLIRSDMISYDLI